MLPFIFAEATGLESVPADFLKYFISVVVAAVLVWAAYRKGRASGGNKGDPFHLAQPVEVKAHVEFAVKHDTERRFSAFAHELEEVRSQMEARRREGLRQYEAIAKQHVETLKAGSERETTLLNAIHNMETRLSGSFLKELKDVHQRLNPVAEEMAAMKATMKAVRRHKQKSQA